MDTGIKSYPLSKLPSFCEQLGYKAFRGKQLIHWLYVIGVSSYEEMTNIPKSLREQLAKTAPLFSPRIIDKQISNDGTRKYVIEYHDGARVETVGMPSNKALSVCFSTQAGCAMACSFCATGAEGLMRNLSAGEILDQLLVVQQDFQRRISHVVSMGQGEPFQNYNATLEAIRFINAPDGFSIGARHITLSTCGILSGIEKLSHEKEQFTLAVSLHSAIQETRNSLMPRCVNIPLTQLKMNLEGYIKRTGRRVSLEYLMINKVTDTQEHLDALLEFCESLLCHINLIPINEVQHSPLKPSSSTTLQHWTQTLTNKLLQEKLSVRETESIARLLAGRDNNKGSEAAKRLPTPLSFKKAAKSLSKFLAAPVRVKTVQGKNKIEIQFQDEEELERILEVIAH